MHPLVSTLAVIDLTFVPIVTIGDWNIRLETIALAVVVLACLIVAVLVARRTPADLRHPPDAIDPGSDEPNHLRADDLLYIAVASLPGAVVGGRLGYALLHLDYYRANPAALLDITQGSFQLSLAIVGGTITAAVVAGLLGAPIGRWMHALILPLLLGIAAGKASLVVGGDGQGLPFDGAWATAYPGPGPWGSLAPEIASHPAQVYEAVATAAVLVVLMVLLSLGAFRRRSGGAFLLGIALWAGARALVAASWRDPVTVGPLRMDQAISIMIALASVVGLATLSLAGAARDRRPDAGASSDGATLDWPDPAARPRF